MRSSHDNTIEAIDIPFIPRQVGLDDLRDGFVINKHSVEKFKKGSSIANIRAKHPEGHKLSRKKHKTPFSLIIAPEYLYAIFCQLGKGSEGKVKWVQNLDTGEWGALKVLICGSQHIEFNNLKSLGKLVTSQEDKPTHFFQQSPNDEKKCREYFIMKAHHGISLLEYIQYYQTHPALVLKVALNILQACRQLNLFHGDIKPENIMINPATGEVELIDFGFAQQLNEEGLLNPDDAFAGTPKYIAPELLIHAAQTFDLSSDEDPLKPIIDIMMENNILPSNMIGIKQPILSAEKISMYSIGILLNELLQLTGGDDTDFIPSKESDNYSQNEIFSVKQINLFFDFLKKMQHPNPEMRPTYDEAIASLNGVWEEIIKHSPPFNISLLDIDSEIEHKDPLVYLCIHRDKIDENENIHLAMANKKNELLNRGYAVADTAFIYTSKKALANYIQTHHEKNRFVTTHYYDCNDGSYIDANPVASPSNSGLFSPTLDTAMNAPAPEVPSLTI